MDDNLTNKDKKEDNNVCDKTNNPCQQLLLEDLIQRCTKKMDHVDDEDVKNNISQCLKRIREEPTEDKILLLQSLLKLTKKQKVNAIKNREDCKIEQKNSQSTILNTNNTPPEKSNLDKILEECRELDNKYLNPILKKKK